MNKVDIKNNSSIELKYQTEGSVGIDVASIEDLVIKANDYAFVNLGVIVKTPKGCMTALLPRSSLFKKKGLMLGNSVGVIDRDYSGNEDVIQACLFNTTNRDVKVLKDERICQLIFIKIETPIINLVNDMDEKSRGGFGSTDR